ncbi:hypothetical protein CV014_01005 [Nostoc sp. CMAA1605]|nr:hypothetical protein [Nostoc sp. CMAA1605]
MSSAGHCRTNKGLGRADSFREAASVYALFAFEGIYLFIGNKSINIGIFGALAYWLNPEQLKESGRCKCLIAPT